MLENDASEIASILLDNSENENCRKVQEDPDISMPLRFPDITGITNEVEFIKTMHPVMKCVGCPNWQYAYQCGLFHGICLPKQYSHLCSVPLTGLCNKDTHCICCICKCV